MNILAIGAHPDDIEQFAGGTLSLLAKNGHKVIIAPLTSGECGSKTLPAKEIVAIRKREAEKAARIIGASYINLGIRDGCVSYDLETTKKVVALIRDTKPDIIITHPTSDYMTDHAHTGRVVLWAVPESTHPNFPAPTKSPATPAQQYMYHTDPQGLTDANGQIVRVNTIVNITETIDQKLKAFSTHASQMFFLTKTAGYMTSVEKTRRWAITRGEQVRVEYGEGFYQNLYAEYPRKNILLDLLPGEVFTL